jgi:hypothetical protein
VFLTLGRFPYPWEPWLLGCCRSDQDTQSVVSGLVSSVRHLHFSGKHGTAAVNADDHVTVLH